MPYSQDCPPNCSLCSIEKFALRVFPVFLWTAVAAFVVLLLDFLAKR